MRWRYRQHSPPTDDGHFDKYINGLEYWEMMKDPSPENLLRTMDKYGVDVGCLLPDR
ncbi:MAG: hypothetical protein U0670_23310 [Anaerolineae bacterium]